MYRRYGSEHSRPLRPPIPFRHKSFNEVREIFVLWLLNDQTEGITGYKFQTSYNIPRGTVLRIFDKLEKKGYIKSKEQTVDGRKQKVFLITEDGKKYLNELREKWAERFSRMGDMAPPERFGHPFLRRSHTDRLMRDIKRLKDKEDAIDYFRGLRHRLNRTQKRLKGRMRRTARHISQLGDLLKFIEKMDPFNKDELKNYIKELKNKSKKHKSTNKKDLKYCKNCGAPINKQMEFCPECGVKLN